jgi:predicted RND superfamily exporter protein
VRTLDLPAGTMIAGNAFVFADVLDAIARDGPRATLVALVGVMLLAGVVLGFRRYAGATVASAVAGTAAMLACASLMGLRVNFLDFVALPITLGIGVDYAVNVAARVREEGPGSVRRALRTTGGAVLLCSFTTVVGYGSLLLSDNMGIRSFGLAAILGEATCLLAAIILTPALLSE